jgi:hypothetical protein
MRKERSRPLVRTHLKCQREQNMGMRFPSRKNPVGQGPVVGGSIVAGLCYAP